MTLIEDHHTVNNGLVDLNVPDNVLFNIKERPLVYFENGGDPVETDYKVLLNAENNSVLYSGKIYSPIHNREIIKAVEQHRELKFEKVRSYYNKRFEFTYTIPDKRIKLGPEETLFSLNIINSYDGSTSLNVVGGLYVLVCSNGAKVGRLTYQFKKKHTSQILCEDISNFIQESVDNIQVKGSFLQQKEWTYDLNKVREQFKSISKIFPAKKDNQVHPAVSTLDSEFLKMEKVYPGQNEFALFMAVTNMTTRPNEYGLGTSYCKAMDSIIGEIFFN